MRPIIDGMKCAGQSEKQTAAEEFTEAFVLAVVIHKISDPESNLIIVLRSLFSSSFLYFVCSFGTISELFYFSLSLEQ